MAAPDELQTALERHLAWWGLRHFGSDERYDEWQRQVLPAPLRERLAHLLEAKRRSQSVADDVAFYDASSEASVLPVLYSQRYQFYLSVGPAMGARLGPAQRILELGCGPAILTTFFAVRHPDRQFLGLDRSPSCIEAARKHAASLKLTNLQLICADLTTWSPEPPVDLVLSAQSLFQAEQDPGLPSGSWRTFERPQDRGRQEAFERRTGLGERLDRVRDLLASNGRAVLFEKTEHLARRVPFQRALAARGLSLLEPPLTLSHTSGGEAGATNLLYLLGRRPGSNRPDSLVSWPESPHVTPRDKVSLCRGTAAASNWSRLPSRQVTATRRSKEARGRDRSVELGYAGALFAYLYMASETSAPVLVLAPTHAHSFLASLCDRLSTSDADPPAVLGEALGSGVTQADDDDPAQVPLYENHTTAAQAVWEALPGRTVEKQAEASEPDGRQLHLELGTSEGLFFVYCANTFDQRQLVVMDQPRRAVLEAYYAELVEANRAVLGASP